MSNPKTDITKSPVRKSDPIRIVCSNTLGGKR